MNTQKIQQVKCLVIGCQSSGKSTFVQSFTNPNEAVRTTYEMVKLYPQYEPDFTSQSL
jgi:GTPase SAR1 family protein